MYIGKAEIPRATSYRLRELYARMHLVNYKKKIKFLRQNLIGKKNFSLKTQLMTKLKKKNLVRTT